MLSSLGKKIRQWTYGNPWTNVYGLARTLLALQTAAVLGFNSADTLFTPMVGVPDPPNCTLIAQISLFCLVPAGVLNGARWVAVLILLLVASGWRPHITGVLHWWVSFSFFATTSLATGGEAITAILTFLLIPLTLTDPRTWHWEQVTKSVWSDFSAYRRFTGWATYLLIRIQIAAIYFHSAAGKVTVEEWVNGTAIYYWFTDPAFGLPPWAEPVLLSMLSHGIVVTAITWGTILLEFFLFAGLIMDKRGWPYLFWSGIGLHAGIAIFVGLPAFSTVMVGALILYLHPLEQTFQFDFLKWKPLTDVFRKFAHTR
ncbi:MAG: hypothetical protein PPP56_06050 [Longimonas sp.]|uniref:sporulation-delaying protein SdpB family protein n=1 Tax=Longimonas sp. TaxID=2039626 RepID=UPI003355EDB7